MTTEHNEQASYTAADMADQGAAQFRAGYAAAKAEQPAAAQEAVAGAVLMNGDVHLVKRGSEQHYCRERKTTRLYAAPVTAAPDEMSPEFTDTARGAIAWVLWHHQGGSSPVGQPLRFALGMGQHEPLPDWRIAEAKRYAEWARATTAKFHEARASTPAAPGIDLEQFREFLEDVPGLGHNGGCRCWQYSASEDRCDCGFTSTKERAIELLALIDASPKGGSESCDGEVRIWGIEKPGSMPKLFGVRHIAELNWYPDEGYDLICMQVVERVKASDAEVRP